jgi:sulfatase-like protein/HEAT repeat protein
LRYADALLCAAGLLLAEWLVVGVLSARQLVAAYELVTTLEALVPLAIVAAAPLCVGGALLAEGLATGDTPRGRILLLVPAVVLAAAVAVGVSGGRLVSGVRPLFVVAVTAAAAAAVWWGARPAARLAAALERRRRWLLAAGAALAVLALELCNARVLPRLYPAFHLGLAVLTLWTAALASLAFPEEPRARRRVRLGVAIAVLATACAAAVGAPERVRLQDNARLVYLEHAPLLANAVLIAAALAPPPPIDDPAGMHAPTAGGGERTVDLGERDLLLVTIDALRADHVGAYGAARRVTPALDALAAEGVVFDAAYTATPHTSYAVTSLMTGKYMRPLLRQGVGDDSETWAEALRRYGWRTAAFYPPAVFFIDRERFTRFEESRLGFEYVKVQFAPASDRATELAEYLQTQATDRRVFVWVHLFEPHEPYEAHADHDLGDRAIDRYDAEVAAADDGLGAIVRTMRAARPETVVIVSADHGEEFDDHGGRYHGTTVYDEQVRVPLVVHAPRLFHPRRVSEPVGLVDLLPTVLGGLGIPASPRIRGRDLGRLLGGSGDGAGFAFAETDEQTLLAHAGLRLVCERRIDACRLYDVTLDPGEHEDAAAARAESFSTMRRELDGFVASLGRYEAGVAPGGWPQALRRGMSGDAGAALDVAGLLDDADPAIRRKAAEVLFDLRREDTAVHLRRSLAGDEDDVVRRWAALGLARMGQGAPLAIDLLGQEDPTWKRLAALALAEAGDARGERVLVAWWSRAFPEEGAAAEEIPFERAREIVAALAHVKSKLAVGPLGRALADVRLRVYVARALEAIGEEAARPALAAALAAEHYHDARRALGEALVSLGGSGELRDPLVRFLGVPDPLPDGLGLAVRADILAFVGGPRDRELERVRQFANSGVGVTLLVPLVEHARPTDPPGLRVVVRALARGDAGEVRFGLAPAGWGGDDRKQPVPKVAPEVDAALGVTLSFPASDAPVERHAELPAAVAKRVKPGSGAEFVMYATQSVEVEALAVVPLARE